jgi:hypothetical protein
MSDFITMAMQQLGLSEQQTRGAAGGLLGLAKSTLGADFDKQLGALPAVQQLMSGATSSPASAGGIGGMLSGLIGKVTGNAPGGIGQAAGVLGILQASGIGSDKAGPFIKLLMDFIGQSGGQAGIAALLGKVPELKKFIG